MSKKLLENAADAAVVDTLMSLLDGRVEAFEIYLSREKGMSLEAKEGSIDAMKVRSSAGVGLRVLYGMRQGFGFSSVLSSGALTDLVGNAVTGASRSAEDKFLGFAAPTASSSATDELGIFDEAFAGVDEKEKIDTAIEIEKSALAYDKRVKRVRKASYSESVVSSRIVNSNGVDLTEAATYYSASVTAVAEEGADSQMGWEMALGHTRMAIDPEFVGSSAGRNAVRMLNARKLATMKSPALIENTVACELLESLAGSFLGDNVEKGKSMLIGKAGNQVASRALNIIDDGLMYAGWSTSVFDGEGMARQRTELLTNGVCNGFLYDGYWARRAGRASTGSAARSGYKGSPGVGISNLYIDKGDKDPSTLMRLMKNGVFITELLGVHTINTVSGDFSLGAAGFMVENGAIAYPIRGLAISGNLLDLFSKVDSCGSDLRFIGSIGAPCLLISEIEASGT
ncbi:MAG: TldD/PmbA family protein [Deltaproteobacteria bacterium]